MQQPTPIPPSHRLDEAATTSDDFRIVRDEGSEDVPRPEVGQRVWVDGRPAVYVRKAATGGGAAIVIRFEGDPKAHVVPTHKIKIVQ
jgi:hypothetical protein